MYKKIYKKVFCEFSGELAKQNLTNIYDSGMRADYKAFNETAKWCCSKMKEIGLSDIEIIKHKADGVSKLGIATPPQAWDVHDAKLEIILPNGAVKVIADYKLNPVSIAMYSASTKGILETEIVDLDSIKRPSDMRGKIVLSSKKGGQVADYVMRNKAAGLVLDISLESWGAGRSMKKTDAVYWENNCFVPQNKYKGFAFVISSAEGNKLRQLLKNNKIRTRAFVKARLYKGTIGTVTGIIPGTRNKEEEVLVVSRLYEIGAIDNAFGCGVTLETARTLITLIEKGKLLRPRRSIRFILSYEVFGLLSFVQAKKGKASKIIAGLNINMAGENGGTAGAFISVGKSLPSNPSFVNDFLFRLIKETSKWKPCFWKEDLYEIFDNDSFISEPCINIPTPYLMHEKNRFYHSNKDTPDKVSFVSLKRTGVITGTYLYFLAGAGFKEACWLGDKIIVTGAKKRILKALKNVCSTSGDLKKEIKKIDYLIDIEERGLHDLICFASGNVWNKHSLRQYIQKYSFDLRDAFNSSYENIIKKLPLNGKSVANKHILAAMNKHIPVKNFLGLPFKRIISEQEKKKIIRLEALLHEVPAIEVFNWIDGKKTILEIYNLLKLKYNFKPEEYLRWHKIAAKYKYIKLINNNRITKEKLVKDLRNMRINKEDVILVHSSLGSIGTVEGGADTVMNALIESVSSKGLVIVPTLTSTDLEGLYAFNPKKTPSRVGEITNALLKRDDSFRSEHPTHSLGAVGAGAEELMKGHNKSTFSVDSPYGKYVYLNPKILFIGTGIGCNTTLHAVEDWLDLPYLTTEKAVIENADGRDKLVKITKCPSGCRDFYKKDSKIQKVFEKEGIIKKGKLGNAEVILISARDVVNTTVNEIKKGNLDVLLCDKKDCKFCTKGKKMLKNNKTKIMQKIADIEKLGLYRSM